MKKFAIEKNIGTREVRRLIKVGSIVEVTLQEENFCRKVAVKITKFTVGLNALFIQGTFSGDNYILDILDQKWMCLSDTDMKKGKILGGVYSGQHVITFDGASGEFYYNDIEQNVKKLVPVEAGDIIRKNGIEYKILAIAQDGAMFIDEMIAPNLIRTSSQKTSSMLRTNDESGYSVFKGLEVIND